ncbi:TNF receptor-associated factor 1 [Exaiptasia diaphana]|nr:TNF receptor-associated factor 1 [Exaiptasia diaphana]
MVDHLTITTQQLLTLQDENINLKKQVLELKASSLEDIIDLKKQVLELKASSSENINDLKKQFLELKASGYSYTWKINDFSKQLQLAKQEDDLDIILYSEPFYSHKYGYKLKLQLYPNGHGDGKGTHVSVFMIIMRGEYDATLTWSFDWKFKFTLLDQKPDHSMRKNIDGGFIIPTTSFVYFKRTLKGIVDDDDRQEKMDYSKAYEGKGFAERYALPGILVKMATRMRYNAQR